MVLGGHRRRVLARVTAARENREVVGEQRDTAEERESRETAAEAGGGEREVAAARYGKEKKKGRL